MAAQLQDIEAASQWLDVQLHGQTAGTNAMHRVPALALAGAIADGKDVSGGQARQGAAGQGFATASVGNGPSVATGRKQAAAVRVCTTTRD